MSRRVVQAHQSPFNEKRWKVVLSCGCEPWVTTGGSRPKKVACAAHPSKKSAKSKA